MTALYLTGIGWPFFTAASFREISKTGCSEQRLAFSINRENTIINNGYLSAIQILDSKIKKLPLSVTAAPDNYIKFLATFWLQTIKICYDQLTA